MPPVSVRIRGIYATALTACLRDAIDVVSPSAAIADRFDGAFDDGLPDVAVEDASDRLGVGIIGTPTGVATVQEELSTVALDTITWTDPAPRGAVFDTASVTETLGSGAIVDLGPREGFLRYDSVSHRIERGDELRVQVRTPGAPWVDYRPEVETEIEVPAGPVTLVRGGDGPRAAVEDPERATELVRTVALVDTTIPEGWAVRFERQAAEATLEQLDEALATAVERAERLHADEGEWDPPFSTAWVWFGRESRFALDDVRRSVTTTMVGHHRLKAASPAASPAVGLVEALCAPTEDDGFPFDVIADQFGPSIGDELALSHGKPDGRRFSLGVGEVIDRDGKTVTLRREMTAGGRYDGLASSRVAGDIAVTRLTEGRWWYPTVYRDSDGDVKGMYVNVCTPLELFPGAATYVDLEVDVVKHPDGRVERLDDDELDEAVAEGHLSERLAAKAREVAASVERGLSSEGSGP